MSISFHVICALVYMQVMGIISMQIMDKDRFKHFIFLEICCKQIVSFFDTNLMSPLHLLNIPNFLKICKTPFYLLSITELFEKDNNGLLPAPVLFYSQIYKQEGKTSWSLSRLKTEL